MNQIAKKMKAKTPTQIKVVRTAASITLGAMGGVTAGAAAHFAFDPIKRWHNLKKWARKRPQPVDGDDSEEYEEILVLKNCETDEDDDIESDDEPGREIYNNIPIEVLKNSDIDTPIAERKTPVVTSKISLRKNRKLEEGADTFLMPVEGEETVPTSREDGLPDAVAAKLGL